MAFHCLLGAWRSVGSPPPDMAVWGRPPYVLPVWRDVIINTTERILTGPVMRPIPTILSCSHSASGALNVRTYKIFPLGLEIPMAVIE